MHHPEYSNERDAIINACIAMNASGINQGTSGNVSIRVADGFLITASGVAYEAMKAEHIVHVTLDGGYYGEFLPSSEWRMHLDIYCGRAKAQAIFHVHSPYATAISCLRQDIPAFHYMIAAAGGNSLRCAVYATFGTERLSQNMMVAMQDRSACLLANHGLICFGADIGGTLALTAEVETLCRQYAIAMQAGKPIILDDEEMRLVSKKFKNYGPGNQKSGSDETSAVIPPRKLDGNQNSR